METIFDELLDKIKTNDIPDEKYYYLINRRFDIEDSYYNNNCGFYNQNPINIKNNFIIEDCKIYDDVCCICLEKNISNVVKLVCNHNYHLECIIKWMETSKTCCLCKTGLYYLIDDFLINIDIIPIGKIKKRIKEYIKRNTLNDSIYKEFNKYNFLPVYELEKICKEKNIFIDIMDTRKHLTNKILNN